MEFLKYLLIAFVILIVLGIAYYYKVINRFKKLIQLEADVKRNPSDEGVQEYMRLYNQTFIPDQEKIKASRSSFYQTIKASNQVSYPVKKELRNFFEEKGIIVLSTIKNELPEENQE